MLKTINGEAAREILNTTSKDPPALAKNLATCHVAGAIEVLNTFDAKHAACFRASRGGLDDEASRHRVVAAGVPSDVVLGTARDGSAKAGRPPFRASRNLSGIVRRTTEPEPTWLSR